MEVILGKFWAKQKFAKKKILLFIIKGIENFNLKTVFMASVQTNFSGASGKFFWSTFDEAKSEGLQLLETEYDNFQKKMEELRKSYRVL